MTSTKQLIRLRQEVSGPVRINLSSIILYAWVREKFFLEIGHGLLPFLRQLFYQEVAPPRRHQRGSRTISTWLQWIDLTFPAVALMPMKLRPEDRLSVYRGDGRNRRMLTQHDCDVEDEEKGNDRQ
jgi:hypothetical protein